MKKVLVLVLVSFMLLVSVSLAIATSPKIVNGKEYYVVSSENPASDTGDEVCASVGKLCVGYTESTTDVCKSFHPDATTLNSVSGDMSGVYCNGAPQGGVCGSETNTCHTCYDCTVSVDCNTPIGGLYREMFVECADAPGCPVKIKSKNIIDFADETIGYNNALPNCPIVLPKSISALLGSGYSKLSVSMNDDSKTELFVKLKSQNVIEFKPGTDLMRTFKYLVETDEDSANALLQSNDMLGTFSTLYSQKKITIKAMTLWPKIKLFFVKPFLNIALKKFQIPITLHKNPAIGPYQGKYVCEFYQTPYPGVNVKRVSCPYETPGAAVNNNADAYCQTAMGSAWARAEVCDNTGLIVCSHPCETRPATLIPNRCAYDMNRRRGSQAAPLNWCPSPKPGPAIPSTAGRPANCEETAYKAHKGYNENHATWDRYMSKTKGVCQSNQVISGCEYTVQLSTNGIPYFLCWYGRKATPDPLPADIGRPANCDDTAYMAHPGYNQNKALWDGYMADSTGVCQSVQGKGTPSPCKHSVQLSRGGHPYYLCWYD